MQIIPSLQKAWREVPVVFLVAPFYYLMLLVLHFRNFQGAYDLPAFTYPALWLTAGLLLTFFLWRMSRWAGVLFILLTVAALCIRYFLPKEDPWNFAGSAAFPADILVACFALFFYKRLR